MTMSIAPASIAPTNSAARSGDQMVSEVTIAVRASGNSSATSSAMRSTPGPAGDQAVLLAAFGAGLGRRHDVAAMVAGEPVHQPVLDHPRGAVGALEAMAAVAAQGQRREAAAVEEQQRLLAALEIGFELRDQRRREPAAARRRVLRQVDRADVGQRRAGEALGQADFAVAAELDHVPAFDRRRRRRQDHRNVLELARASPPCRGRDTGRRLPA